MNGDLFVRGLTEAEATTATAVLVGVAAAIAALELLVVRAALGEGGRLRWASARRELAGAPRPVRALADACFGGRRTVALAGLQLAAAVTVPWLTHPAPAWLLAAACLALSIRFRGAYNGGSDAMLLVVALALALARTAPGTALGRAGLAWAAVQVVLSYFVAGVAKLGDRRWLDGRAMPFLVRLPHYHVPAWAQALLSWRPAALGAAWAMLGFELVAPAALVDRRLALGVIGFGAAFHLANALVFGLNRFLWTWLAAYPALLFWAGRAGG